MTTSHYNNQTLSSARSWENIPNAINKSFKVRRIQILYIFHLNKNKNLESSTCPIEMEETIVGDPTS